MRHAGIHRTRSNLQITMTTTPKPKSPARNAPKSYVGWMWPHYKELLDYAVSKRFSIFTRRRDAEQIRVLVTPLPAKPRKR